MHNGRRPLPTYAQSCGEEHERLTCAALCADPLKEPLLLGITLAAVIGCFCLLSGLMLLCMVSQAIQDRTSEAILLLGMGFFICAVASVTWRLTNQRRLARLIQALKEETTA